MDQGNLELKLGRIAGQYGTMSFSFVSEPPSAARLMIVAYDQTASRQSGAMVAMTGSSYRHFKELVAETDRLLESMGHHAQHFMDIVTKNLSSVHEVTVELELVAPGGGTSISQYTLSLLRRGSFQVCIRFPGHGRSYGQSVYLNPQQFTALKQQLADIDTTIREQVPPPVAIEFGAALPASRR